MIDEESRKQDSSNSDPLLEKLMGKPRERLSEEQQGLVDSAKITQNTVHQLLEKVILLDENASNALQKRDKSLNIPQIVTVLESAHGSLQNIAFQLQVPVEKPQEVIQTWDNHAEQLSRLLKTIGRLQVVIMQYISYFEPDEYPRVETDQKTKMKEIADEIKDSTTPKLKAFATFWKIKLPFVL